ncbi:hypothetical protein ACKVMT_01300 [Halobacteriales archaeon Cl-PHB]
MGDRTSSWLDRRQVLATVAAATGATSIAGCASFRDAPAVGDSGATDVILHSTAAESKTVSITVTDVEADQPHTDTTVDIQPGAVVDPVNDGKLPTTTSGYTVEVDVQGGPSETFEWTDPTVQLAPLWVQVDDSPNVLFLLQAG